MSPDPRGAGTALWAGAPADRRAAAHACFPRLGHLCTARLRATTRPSARRWCSTALPSSLQHSAMAPPPSRSATPTARVTRTAPLTWQVRGRVGQPLGEEVVETGPPSWQVLGAGGEAADCHSRERGLWGFSNYVAESQRRGRGGELGLSPGRCKQGQGQGADCATFEGEGVMGLCTCREKSG